MYQERTSKKKKRCEFEFASFLRSALPRLELEIRSSIIPPGLKEKLSTSKFVISDNDRFNARHKLLGYNGNNGHVFTKKPEFAFRVLTAISGIKFY